MSDRRCDQAVTEPRHAAHTGRNANIETAARALLLGSLTIGGAISLVHLRAGLALGLTGGIGSLFLHSDHAVASVLRKDSQRDAAANLVLIVAVLLAAALAIAFLILTPVQMPLAVPVGLAGAATWPLWRRRQRTQSSPCQPASAQVRHTPLDLVTAGENEDLMGDPERNAVLDVLKDQFVGGYLSQAMFDERCDIAIKARRRGELIPALLDLNLQQTHTTRPT